MKRLKSLDALRGFDMIWILGLEWTVRGLCRLVPGWQGGWLDMQVRHVPWEGLAFFDTIFPLFIFIAGVTFPFAHARQRERGLSALQIHLNIFRRAAMLILLGMVYNGILSFRFEHFRYASVLGKIGVAWMVAAVCHVHFGAKTLRLFFLATGGCCILSRPTRLPVRGRLRLRDASPAISTALGSRLATFTASLRSMA